MSETDRHNISKDVCQPKVYGRFYEYAWVCVLYAQLTHGPCIFFTNYVATLNRAVDSRLKKNFQNNNNKLLEMETTVDGRP